MGRWRERDTPAIPLLHSYESILPIPSFSSSTLDPSTTDHACLHPSCVKSNKCNKFYSPWVCNCGCKWSDHTQLVRRLGDRRGRKRRQVGEYKGREGGKERACRQHTRTSSNAQAHTRTYLLHTRTRVHADCGTHFKQGLRLFGKCSRHGGIW